MSSNSIAKANISLKSIFSRALRIFLITLIYIFFSIVFVQITFIDNMVIKALLNLAMLLIFLSILYSNGLKNGELDSAFSEIINLRLEKGDSINDFELSKCFSIKRSFLEGYIGFSVFILLALILSAITKLNYFEDVVKPSWLKAYYSTENFSIYFSNVSKSYINILDFLRLIARLVLFPIFNSFSSENIRLSLIVERLSPIIISLFPFAYIIGYLQGPKKRKQIKEAIMNNNKGKRK